MSTSPTTKFIPSDMPTKPVSRERWYDRSLTPKTNPVEKLNDDFDFVKEHLEQINATMTISHGALSEIVKCDVSFEGAIGMKAIAEAALVEIQRIALAMGGKLNA